MRKVFLKRSSDMIFSISRVLIDFGRAGNMGKKGVQRRIDE